MFEKILSKLGYERKESRATSAIVALGIGQAVWTPRNYAALAKAGYQTNSDYYAGVSLIAGAAAQIPWLVYDKKDGKEAKRSGAGAELKALLERPNDRMDGNEFKFACIAYMLLAGNRYMERVGPEQKESSRPKELYVLRPDLMNVVKGNTLNPIGGYEFRENGRTIQYQRWQVLHQKTFHPLDDWYGMAPIEAAGYPIDISNESSALFNKLLKKGYPAGWIKPTPNWNDKQIGDFRQGLYKREKDNDWIFGDGIEEINPMGFDVQTAGIKDGKLLSKRDIAAVLNLAPEMLGDSQSKTYANFSEARRGLYTEAVIPRVLHFRDGLNAWLSPLFDGAYIDIDRDAIDALQEDRNEAAKRVVLLFKSDLIKKNEGRSELKYEPVPEEEDGFYSELVEQLSSEDDAAVDQDQSEEEDSGVGSSLSTANSRAGKPNPKRTPGRRKRLGSDYASVKAFNLSSEEAKDNYWKSIEEQREEWYENIQKRVSSRFNDERKSVQRAFINGGQAEALKAQALQSDEWSKLYLDIYSDVAPDFGRSLLAGIKQQMYEVKFEDDIFSVAVRTWLSREGAKRVVGIGETTREKIAKELKIGTDAGESISQLSRRLQSMYSEFSISRAERIARTEVISASNLGSQTAARSTNLPLEKEWISTLDQRTRDWHAGAHGQVRDMDQPYIVMGQRLMFPGDGSMGASADNLIMCRCTESYRVKRA